MNIDLYRECSTITNQVPKGMVTTYGALAMALGDMRARRAVGVMMNTYTPEYMMPCHRVVYAGGKLGGFAYGSEEKIERLAPEGVFVLDGQIVDFNDIYFTNFRTSHPKPLERARQEQLKLAKLVDLEDAQPLPELVLGLDVAYSRMRAFGVGVLYDMQKMKPTEMIEESDDAWFPYVPTYLAYRELPLIKKITEKLDEPATLMLDGNGILHPYGIGIASHVGVLFDVPAIGVAKRLLCGEVASPPTRVGDSSPVTRNDKIIGHALKTSQRSKEVYVSPGHRITHEAALNVVSKISRFKQPEPLRLAHIKAKELKERTIGKGRAGPIRKGKYN